jgi:hypothetical protein
MRNVCVGKYYDDTQSTLHFSLVFFLFSWLCIFEQWMAITTMCLLGIAVFIFLFPKNEEKQPHSTCEHYIRNTSVQHICPHDAYISFTNLF